MHFQNIRMTDLGSGLLAVLTLSICRFGSSIVTLMIVVIPSSRSLAILIALPPHKYSPSTISLIWPITSWDEDEEDPDEGGAALLQNWQAEGISKLNLKSHASRNIIKKSPSIKKMRVRDGLHINSSGRHRARRGRPRP